MHDNNSSGIKILFVLIFIPIIFTLLLNITYLLKQTQLSFTLVHYTLIFQNKYLQGFSTIFLSILLEAIPFILIGTIISSIIQIFVSEDTIAKIIPKNKFVGILSAALLGLIFPICDCAIVPVVRRLIKKGVPLHISITFMLAVPIVNPVVLSATYYAFSNNPYMVLARGGFGIISAMLIGFLISMTEGNNKVLKETVGHSDTHIHNPHHDIEEEGCECGHIHSLHKKGNFISLLVDIFEHTTIELHDVGRFLIMGSFLSAIMQTFIPRKYILFVGRDGVLSILVMIMLAFLLAVCSETDAFIARTFVGQFTSGSIIAFLIFGPMIDIKNTLMLSGSFKGRFIIKLIFCIFSVCFILGALINYFEAQGGYLWLNSIKMSLSGL